MSKKRPILHLPDTWRDELKNPIGPTITDNELPKYIKDQLLAGVGDVAAVHIRRAGYKPKLVIVDFKTRRGDEDGLAPEIRLIGKECIKVLNPPAQITPALWDAVEKAYALGVPVRIEVEGEEDLASLVCIVTAPMGSLVIYGMPGQGMAVVTVNKHNKVMAQKALDSMRKA